MCYLLATLHHRLAKLLRPYSFLLVEELAQNVVALLAGHLTEVLAQHVSHQFHLRVHHPTVGLDDV